MALPVTVPNQFASATASIPLSQLDTNFTTLSNAINGIANGVESLANVQVTGGNIANVTIADVTVTSGNVTATNVTATQANVTTALVTNLASGNVTITGGSVSNVTINTSNVAGGDISNVTTSNVALKFYNVTGADLGTTSGNVTIALSTGNFFSATTNANATWIFANASPANSLSGVVLALTNGGAYDQTWTNVAWSGGAAPTLTAAGLDILVFVSYDGGTNWNGMPASLDSQ
jgi:hypothetical protein